MSKPLSRKARIAAWLRERVPTRVELTDFEELAKLLAPVSDSELRRLLRESGSPLHPLVEGVDQESYATLRRTLLALAALYENGDAVTRRLCRSIVITAREHATLASKNRRLDDTRRAVKTEMASWMLIWLENPPAFALWIPMRWASLKLD